MPAPGLADWRDYEQKVYALFETHFKEHADTFKIKSLETSAAAIAPAAGQQGGIGTEIVESARWNEEDERWEDIDGAEFTLFPPNMPIPPPEFEFDPPDQTRIRKARGTYSYLTPLTSAVCNPVTEDTRDGIGLKLTTGTNILQRYVGSYLAAVLEMLADYVWLEKEDVQSEEIQSNVLQFEWACTGTGTNFFNALIGNLVTSLRAFLPVQCWDFAWVDPDGTGAQREFQSMFIDYTLAAKAALVAHNFEATIDGQTIAIRQEYKIATILVEIKVNKVEDNTEKRHRAQAVNNIVSLNGSGLLQVGDDTGTISTCYCLSHGSNADGNVLSTATTLAVEPRPNMIRAVFPQSNATGIAPGYDARDVPFVRYDSLVTTRLDTGAQIKIEYAEGAVGVLKLATGETLEVPGTEVLVES